MNRIRKATTYVQIFVMVYLALCSVGVFVNSPKKPFAYPCKEHVCGCKSEADCMSNCCCFPDGNRQQSQNGTKENKNGLLAFISSIKCKSGSNAITCINTKLKYVQEDSFINSQITFLCFLAKDTLVRLCEPTVSPPEKPPRHSRKA